jgi:hypothetical protein
MTIAPETSTVLLPSAAVEALTRLDAAFPGLLVPESESLVTPVAPEVQRAIVRYEAASEHCRALAEAGDYDGCLAAQDEMAMCRCQLAAAGRLDLIGADR